MSEVLWLIETSELAVKGDPTYPQRHFWDGRGWNFDPLKAARYPLKESAEIIREKEKMYPLDKYPVCDHMFGCGIEPDEALTSRLAAMERETIERCAKVCDEQASYWETRAEEERNGDIETRVLFSRYANVSKCAALKVRALALRATEQP